MTLEDTRRALRLSQFYDDREKAMLTRFLDHNPQLAQLAYLLDATQHQCSQEFDGSLDFTEEFKCMFYEWWGFMCKAWWQTYRYKLGL